MEQIRLSVRGLVEFTLHGEDIRPGGSMRVMQEGTLGHKARQALLGEGWQSEVPLSMVIPVEEDCELLLAGRMDAFLDGDVPLIEEIKLWQGHEPPEAAQPAHSAQAVCYGHILCQQRGLPYVDVRVTYVTKSGRVRGQFDEHLSAQECMGRFQELLLPYLRRMKTLRLHRRARNASLQALSFPYPDYRAGQREMAVQVYTAIRLGRRLFASMPTGTGKSVAALFPALKALGAGLTGQVYYLTARTTQRQGALEALTRMRRQPLHLWVLTLDAKDKQCPHRTVCHPDWCPRAKGHFLRDGAALEEMLQTDDWSPAAIRRMADQYDLCPFEFSLSLAELADVTICDYNYALDPAVHIQRIFDRTADVTLLIDEAHNLLSRVREMLGGEVDGGRIRRLRTVVGKAAGRKHPLYKAMTGVLKALDDLPLPEGEEGALASIPQSLDEAVSALTDAFLAAQMETFPWDEAGERLSDTTMALLGFLRARRRESGEYAYLWQGAKTRKITAFALDVGGYLSEVTEKLSGVVCFSATMEPLPDMKRLLGGGEEDACFAMPSPFPRDDLLVARADVNTRYRYREAACGQIAAIIRDVISAKPGRYIAFFPSFAFMNKTADALSELDFQLQRPSMTEAERQSFLSPYKTGGEPVLSLCVLGGIFSEGIDLPGDALDGVIIIGVGLPQVGLFQETLRDYYEQRLGSGFLYAYMIPGMQKVAQAVGRVIRTETDRGVAILLDDRYGQEGYRRLCPAHWDIRKGNVAELARSFWAAHEKNSRR